MSKGNKNLKKDERILRLLEKGKLGNALKLTDTRDIGHLLRLGASFGQQGRHDLSERVFQRALELNPNLAEPWTGKGIALRNVGKYRQALECHEKAIKINPKLAQAWTNKGAVLSDIGNYVGALKCHEKAIEINPKLADARTNKGAVLVMLGKYAEAIECFDRALEIDPCHAETWYNKGGTLEHLHNYPDALKCYDKTIEINPNLVKAWLHRAFILTTLGKYVEAFENDDRATEMNPNSAQLWYHKGMTLGELGRFNEALSCFDHAISIDRYQVGAWSGRGLALDELGRRNEALTSHDKAIRIDPNQTDAWTKKGITLKNLGRYPEAIGCFDRALKIDPRNAWVWSNRGTVLGLFGRYKESLRSHDEALKIGPDLGGIHGNKALTWLYAHKYDEARAELKVAEKLFSRMGLQVDVNKAHALLLLAENGADAMLRMDHLDQQFLTSLESTSLAQLEKRTREISKEAVSIVDRYIVSKPVPGDVKELLSGKLVCLSLLLDAVRFRKDINLDMLEEARGTFKKWGLNAYVSAANSIDTFVRLSGQYDSIREVPEELEEQLLKILGATRILVERLTRQITKRTLGEPFSPKPVKLRPEPEIRYIKLADRQEDWVRICLVQLDFGLTQKFPYKLADKQRARVRNKVFEALDIAKNAKADIICFPELSFTKEWIGEIKDNCSGIMIVCGTFYNEMNQNLCKIIIEGEEYTYAKCHCSLFEESNGEGMKEGQNLFLFDTKWGLISVLTCADFDNEYDRICQYAARELGRPLDITINPRYDIDKDYRFQDRSDLSIERPDASRNSCFILHVNANDIQWGDRKGGGGTTIVCYEHVYRLTKYKNDGLRPNDKVKYKICQARGEMMLTADLKIGAGQKQRIKMGDWYRHQNKRWQPLTNKDIWEPK